MRRLAVTMLALVLLGSLAAAGSAAPPKRYSITGAGATIAVPAAWETLDRRTVTNSAAFRRFIDENPALQPFVAQMTGPSSAIKLMAFDLKLSGSFATNVNVVLSTPAPSGLTPQQVASIYGRELKARLTTIQGPVAASVVRLPAGTAVRASYKVRFTNQGRRLTVQTLQYLVLRPDKSLVVTFSTLPSESARRSATFTTIARSLRFSS